MSEVRSLISACAVVALLTIPERVSGAFEGLAPNSADFLLYGPILNQPASRGWATLERAERYGLPELAVTRASVGLCHRRTAWKFAWASSGDDLYRENRFSAGCSFGFFRPAAARIEIIADLYHLQINNYGSSTAPGLGVKSELQLGRGVLWSGGIDGLLVGSLKTKGSGDITRSSWSSLTLTTDGGMALLGAIELPEEGDLGGSLGVALPLTGNLGGRLLLCDRPARVGAGFYLRLGLATLSFAASEVAPLGWTRSAIVRFEW